MQHALIKIHMLVIWKLNIQEIFLSSFFCFCFVYDIYFKFRYLEQLWTRVVELFLAKRLRHLL